MGENRRILGEVLIAAEGVAAEAVEAALGPRRRAGERIGDTLVRTGATTRAAVARALAGQLGLPLAPDPLVPDAEALELIRPDLAHRHNLVPIRANGRTISIAMADPLDVRAMDDVQFQTGRRVEVFVSMPSTVEAALRDAWGTYTSHREGSKGTGGPGGRADVTESGEGESMSDLIEALPAAPVHAIDPVQKRLERETRRAPVVRLVDRILRQAIDEGASDIHLEETGADVQVRLRIDGRLRRSLDLPAESRRAVLSRLKVLSGMDIAVRRRAQDGRLRLEHGGRRLALRVSTLPVNGGEKAVVRILDGDAAPEDLGRLGLGDAALTQLRNLIARGEGVILAAGPTGSGKSTTLFAALSEIDRVSRNVVTIEDPVEYRLEGASQVQVDARAGLGFADALRSVLRQDPDVVMVGEIRDRETAEIAMAAAVTGHLVLSTIHTTDAPAAVTRLLHMGVPPFLVAGGLAGVVAQRLVRRCCTSCRGRGCAECTDGLRGRTGVYQLLTVTDAMRDEISRGQSSDRLRRLAHAAGMQSLESDARRAVATGLTTPHEVRALLMSSVVGGLPCAECGTTVPFGAAGCPECGAARGRACPCGQPVERGWRFCPWCLRRAAA
jgi:type IV pilus assembly protein PilB